MRATCLVPIAAILVLHLVSAKSIDDQRTENVMTMTVDNDDINQNDLANDTKDGNAGTEPYNGLLFNMPIWIAVLACVLMLICCFCCMRCAMDYDMLKMRPSVERRRTPHDAETQTTSRPNGPPSKLQDKSNWIIKITHSFFAGGITRVR